MGELHKVEPRQSKALDNKVLGCNVKYCINLKLKQFAIMKKYFMFLAAALMVACGGGDVKKESGVTINGDFTGMDGVAAGDVVKVVVMGEEDAIAEAVVGEDLTFELKTDIDEEQFASFFVNDENFAMICFDGNDMTVVYDAEEDSLDWEGSELHTLLRGAMDDFMEILYDEEATEEMLFAFLDNFVVENKDNAASIYMLQYYAMFGGDQTRFAELVDMIDVDFDHIQLYNEHVKFIENAKNTAIGADLQDLQLPDAEGNIISVAELCKSGKWVLVDFWATWCGPCRAEIPHLVAAYEKFAPKGLEIYGVSFDNPGTEARWKQFVKDNSMTWINVWGTDDEGKWSVAEHLNVNAIPANFLYSPEGKLVAKNLRGENIEEVLAEHIK